MSLAEATSPVSRPTLRVGDIARQSGKTVRAIRLYEELGLLKPDARSPGGFRLYDESALERVRWIELLSGLGFSLTDMRAVIDRWRAAGRAPEAMADLRELFEKKLEETRAAISRQHELELELLAGLDYLRVCGECEQLGPTRVCAACEMDHGVDNAPRLLAGLQRGPALVRIADTKSNR